LQIGLHTALLSLVVTALLIGCSAAPSTTTTTAWRDPNFNGPRFTRIFVVGLGAQGLTDQRGFENVLVSALQSVGVEAVPGWRFVATDRTPDQSTMRAAVLQSGADAALLVRLSDWQTESSVGVGTVGQEAALGPNMYVGWYEPGIVSTSYQARTIYSTLFDARTAKAVWTYNPPVYNPATQQDASAFANDVAGRLQSSGLLSTH